MASAEAVILDGIRRILAEALLPDHKDPGPHPLLLSDAPSEPVDAKAMVAEAAEARRAAREAELAGLAAEPEEG